MPLKKEDDLENRIRPNCNIQRIEIFILNFFMCAWMKMKQIPAVTILVIFEIRKSRYLPRNISSTTTSEPSVQQMIWHSNIQIKATVHHFRKIGGCLDSHQFSPLILVFISLRCFEPVGLTKNLNISIPSFFEHRILDFF